MGILGRVEVFNNSNEDWPQYVERHFFVVNAIDAAEKKRAVLLSTVCASTTSPCGISYLPRNLAKRPTTC